MLIALDPDTLGATPCVQPASMAAQQSAFASKLNPGEVVQSECRAQFMQQSVGICFWAAQLRNNQPALEGLLAWTDQRLLFLSVERRKLNHVDHSNIDNLLYNEGQLMIRVQVVLKNVKRQLHFRFKQPEQLRDFVQCYQSSAGNNQQQQQPPPPPPPAVPAEFGTAQPPPQPSGTKIADSAPLPGFLNESAAKRPRLSMVPGEAAPPTPFFGLPAGTGTAPAAQPTVMPTEIRPQLLHPNEDSLQAELLQRMLVDVDGDSDDALQARATLEIRAALLARDAELAAVYQSLVPQVLDDGEFWTQRKDLLDREMARADQQLTGRSREVPVPVADDSKRGVNKVRYVFNSQLIHDIFLEHPAVFHAYQETVGLGRMSEKLFWQQYLKSQYFHRQRKFGDLAPPPAPQSQTQQDRTKGVVKGHAGGGEDEIDIFTRAQLQAMEAEEAEERSGAAGGRAKPGMQAFGGSASVYAKLKLQHPQVDLRYSESLASASRQLGEPSTGVVDLAAADSDPGRQRVGSNPAAVEALVDALFSGRIPTAEARSARLSGKTLSRIDQQKARAGLVQKFNRHAHLVLHLRQLRMGSLAQMEQAQLQEQAEKELLAKQRGSRRNKELHRQQMSMAKARAQGRTAIDPESVEIELEPKTLRAEEEIEAEDRYHAELLQQLTLEDSIRPAQPEFKRLQIQGSNASYFQTASIDVDAESEDPSSASSAASASTSSEAGAVVKQETISAKVEANEDPDISGPPAQPISDEVSQRAEDWVGALRNWRFGQGFSISPEDLDEASSSAPVVDGSASIRCFLEPSSMVSSNSLSASGYGGSVLPMVARLAAESQELPEDRLARFMAGKQEFLRELRLRYARCFELFRHFWSCIPVTQGTLRKFQRLAEPLGQHYRELEAVIHQLNNQGDNELTQLLHPLRDSFLAIFPKYDAYEKLRVRHERFKAQQKQQQLPGNVSRKRKLGGLVGN